MFTEYCCRIVLGDDWERVSKVLDQAIKVRHMTKVSSS